MQFGKWRVVKRDWRVPIYAYTQTWYSAKYCRGILARGGTQNDAGERCLKQHWMYLMEGNGESLSMHTHRPKMWHGMARDSGPAVGVWPRSQNEKWDVISLKKVPLYLSAYSPIPSLLFTSINHCLSYCIRTCVLWKQGCIPIIHTFKVFANTLHGDNIHDWVCGWRLIYWFNTDKYTSKKELPHRNVESKTCHYLQKRDPTGFTLGHYVSRKDQRSSRILISCLFPRLSFSFQVIVLQAE